MFVGFNADGDDGIAFVTLVDIPNGTSIHFNDNEWGGSAFNNNNEGEHTWTNNSGSGILAGTVITIIGPGTASIGSFTGSNLDLAQDNETVYAFIGTDNETPTTFLSAITNDVFAEDGPLTNTGLTIGLNAIEFDSQDDVLVYNGSTTCNGALADCAAQIANTNNWATENGSSVDDNSIFPDYPDDVTANFSGSALPIYLVNFEAFIKGNITHLHWRTSTEINNDYMAIERSSDGRTFKEIGRVQGAGTTQVEQSYSFVDERPLSGVNYYRLRQVDFDGRYEYHETVAVDLSSETPEKLLVYPTQAKDHIQIVAGTEMNEDAQVQVLSTDGKIWKTTLWLEKSTQMELSVAELPAGSYWLRILNREGIQQAYFHKI